MMVRRSMAMAVHLNRVSPIFPMLRQIARRAGANILDMRHFIHELVCIAA
jgi:hypothetical protein